MKNLIKLTVSSFVILTTLSVCTNCNSTESEDKTQEQQEQQEEQNQEQKDEQEHEKEIEQEEQAITTKTKQTITGQTLRMIGDKVNVRSKPSIKGEIITQLRINEVFDIKGKTNKMETIQTQSDYWYQIEKNGKSGWVFGALTTETLNEKENSNHESSTLTIWGNKVNIRTKPSLKGDVIMQLNDGKVVTVKKQSKEYETIGYDTDYWYQIEINGKRGWVFGTFTSRMLIVEGCSG